MASTIDEVFEDCPYEGGYDLKIGEACGANRDLGDPLDFVNFSKNSGFKHALVFFGGLGGIEGLVEDLETSKNLKVREMFDEYVNACPEIGTRNMRTEESLLITLGALVPKLREFGSKQSTPIEAAKKEAIKSTML